MSAAINYFKESWQELKRVTWPTRGQTIRFTIAVLLFSFVLSMFMGVADLGLDQLVKKVIIKE